MKYIAYTFVDDATRIPVSQEPARKGPVIPEGVVHLFSIESSFSSGIPQFYGTLEQDGLFESWMFELTEEVFLEIYKSELKTRLDIKRKSLKLSLEKDIKGLSRITQAISAGVDLQSFDFLSSSGWKTLSGFEAIEMFKVVATQEQKLFSLVHQIEKLIESSDLEGLSELSETISSLNEENICQLT